MRSTAQWYGLPMPVSRYIDKFQKIKKRATKFIVETEDSYDTRLKKLEIILTDATLSHKALNGITNIHISPYVDFYSDADCYSF